MWKEFIKAKSEDCRALYNVEQKDTLTVADIEVSYDERFGGGNTDGPPCTLNGFIGSRNGEVVPEWLFEKRHLPNDRAKTIPC